MMEYGYSQQHQNQPTYQPAHLHLNLLQVCDIYLGIVYYQRLRHMVSDKFQVGVAGGGR